MTSLSKWILVAYRQDGFSANVSPWTNLKLVAGILETFMPQYGRTIQT